MTREVVSAAALTEALPMREAIAAVSAAFLSLARGEFVAPLRTSFDSGRTLVMPVFHTPSGSSATKSILLRPGEQPALRGMVTWISDDVEMAFDAHAVTTLRTGAVVGAATALLAPSDARSLLLIGAGTQAMDQVRAVLAVRDIETVVVASRSSASADKLRDRLLDLFPGVVFTSTTDGAAVMSEADIVSCATSSMTPVFDAQDLPERVHVNAVGAYTLAMRELPSATFAGADVVVDSKEAARAEAGDLMAAVLEGVVDQDSVSELGSRLLVHREAGAARTVFKSVGLGIQDWAICDAVASRLGG